MGDEEKELLKNAGIIETDYQYCYISDNQIFTPLKDKNGEMIKTGEQVYNEDYLNPPAQQPNQEDLLRAKLLKDNANIQLQLAQQQKLNADILLKIAKLGGSTNV